MPKSSHVQNSEDLLKKFYDVVAACNRCGFCTSYCPTYNATGNEGYSPRGRNQTLRALIEGRIDNPAESKDIIDTCLLCGECTSVCFSEVPTADLMVQARYFLNQKKGLPFGLKWFLYKVLPHNGLYSALLKFSFLGKKLGISKAMAAVGLLKKISKPLAAADKLMERVPYRFFKDYSKTKKYQDVQIEKDQREVLVYQKKMFALKKQNKKIPEKILEKANRVPKKPRVAFLTACGSQYVRPKTSLATFSLLQKLNVDMHIPEVLCCGLPAASYGVLDQVRSFAEKNIALLEKRGFSHFVVDDSSCLAHFKDYAHFFKDDAAWFEKAQQFSQKIREFSSFLIRYGIVDHLKKTNWTGGPVAFHDPCKAQYAQKTTEPPREILSSIPNLKLVPVAEADQCCGGGGTYGLNHPELSQSVMAKKIDHIIESGATTLITTSTSCLIQLEFGLRKKKSQIKVFHLAEFLAQQLKLKTT